MKTETIAIRVTEAEKERLKAIAEKRDVSISQIIREVLKEVK